MSLYKGTKAERITTTKPRDELVSLYVVKPKPRLG